MKTILVTGAGGYIGSTLSTMLLEAGHRVIGVDRYFFGTGFLSPVLSNSHYCSVRKDVRDMTPGDFEGVDGVCDLAALSNDPSGDLDPELTEAINHRGRLRVARAAKEAGVPRYVLASSCSVYGQSPGIDLSEEAIPKPITTYAKANLGAEREILPLADDRFTVTVLRQATVFGLSKRMRFDLVINLMTLNAVQKSQIFVLGGGKQWRPIVHVADTSRAFLTVLGSDPSLVNGEIFNVGATNLQVLSLAYIVRENLPFPIQMDVVPDDPDKRNYNVSFEKIRTKLGYTARYTAADGVREIYEALKTGHTGPEPHTYTVNWYRQMIAAKALLDSVMINGRLLN
jgi:nucleoside-diphosphate-sugar epimerase